MSSNSAPVPTLDNLLTRVKAFLVRHIVVSDAAATIVSLWIVWTHLAEHTYFKPRLAIISPQPRCGKSTLMHLLEMLVANPIMCSNITTAALFRSIADASPTVLIDEADTFLNQREEISNIINSGFEATGTVLRCAPKTNEVVRFKVGSPLAIAAIGSETLRPSVLDRSILIEMKRKSVDQQMEVLRRDKPAEAHALRDEIATLVRVNGAAVENAPDPDLPSLGSDRAADKFRPLMMVAELAGPHWSLVASNAATELTLQMASIEPEGLGVRLLTDIEAIIARNGEPAIKSKELLASLTALEDAPWIEAGAHGRALTLPQLAKQLATFGIKPKVVRFGTGTARGYVQADFSDAFQRYLPGRCNNETA